MKQRDIRLTAPLMMTALMMAATLPAQAGQADSLRTVDIEDITITASSPKEHLRLREQPLAASLFNEEMLRNHHVETVKGVSALTPNLFIPEYGSSLTSSIYIRGIGSRINTPAVGLYVDNVPYIDKSAFDFDLTDIERVDVLRGPQGTLYGRNTMGGLIRIHTRNPFHHPGTEVCLSAATGNNSGRLSLTHRMKLSDRLALSAGGWLREERGFFRNDQTGRWADPKRAGGAHLRTLWLPTEELKLDFTADYNHTDEGGYAYRYTGATDPAAEAFPEEIGKITANRPAGYRRSLLNAGLHAEWQLGSIVLNSVTGYQHVDDDMDMDQDFLSADIYTLAQRQHLHTLSEELSVKSRTEGRWQWTTGLFAFRQWADTEAPVNFYADGMGMLGGMLGRVIPQNIDVQMGPMTMQIHPSLSLATDAMPIDGSFDTPVTNAALFHQSSYKVGRFTITAGLRLEYERLEMTYNSGTELPYNVSVQGTMNRGGQPMTISMMDTLLTVSSRYEGSLDRDYVQLLPKLAVQYDLPGGRGNLYATLSKGYRSGGYNLQMFSDLLQTRLRSDMMTQSRKEILGNVPAAYLPMVEQHFPTAPEVPDAQAAVEYDAEEAWNYEVGTHLQTPDGTLKLDAALFLTDTRNQQISRFAPNGLGRETVNAGRSRSLGAELALWMQPHQRWTVNLSYGYTHATFREYDGGTESGSEQAIDYSDNRIPFVPEHTLSAGASYTLPTPWGGPLQSLLFRAGLTGAGRIYWTEQNNAWQDFYALTDAGVTLDLSAVQLDLWVRNLADTDYDTFYFESMSRGFAQTGRPRQFGMDLRIKF